MMKMMQTSLLFSLLIVSTCASSDAAHASVCLNKTAIVYSNGMFNDRDQADAAREILSIEVHAKLAGSKLLSELEINHLAYASDGSQFQIGGAHPIIRLMDAIIQFANTIVGQPAEVILQAVLQDNLSEFWRWLGGIQGVSQPVQDIMNKMAAATNANTYLFDPDLQKQIATYRKLLNSGEQVVIVSHSQGNFYANAAYNALTNASLGGNPAWMASIGNVQVATPSTHNSGSKLGNNEPHITVPEDWVMKAAHLLSPATLLSTKPASGKSANMTELVTSAHPTAWEDAVYGHNFVKWYLAGSYTRNFILNGMVQTIGKLQYPTPNMIARQVTVGNQLVYGIRVAPAPDGSIYVSLAGGGVQKIDETAGTIAAVPGVPRVDAVGPNGSLYYNDDTGTPGSFPFNIYKVNPAGVTSLVYSAALSNANPAKNQLSNFDVGSDGSVYVGDHGKYYKISPAGNVTHIFGRPPAPICIYKCTPPTLTGIPALDTVVSGATHVKAGFNGELYFGLGRHSYTGQTESIARMASVGGVLLPGFPIQGIGSGPAYGGKYDVCRNGNLVYFDGAAPGDIVLYDFNQNPVRIATTGASTTINFKSVKLDDRDETLYFVDSATNAVMKLVPNPN